MPDALVLSSSEPEGRSSMRLVTFRPGSYVDVVRVDAKAWRIVMCAATDHLGADEYELTPNQARELASALTYGAARADVAEQAAGGGR